MFRRNWPVSRIANPGPQPKHQEADKHLHGFGDSSATLKMTLVNPSGQLYSRTLNGNGSLLFLNRSVCTTRCKPITV
jgi:hypothetical protein